MPPAAAEKGKKGGKGEGEEDVLEEQVGLAGLVQLAAGCRSCSFLVSASLGLCCGSSLLRKA